jgi:sugar-specific transcriptional regulator TrmB
MQERIKKFLQDIGLSEKEAAVYLSLLSVDSASVIELSKSTDINRTTLYPILDDLIAKKLVIETKQDKKVRFQAEPPERIETYVQNRKNQLEEQEKVLEDIIPQMRGFVRHTGERPVVKFFEGREGILESLNTYYEAGDNEKEEYLIYPRRDIKDLFSPKEQEKAKSSRIKRKIFMNSIFTSEEDYPSNELAARYRIDSDKYKISAEIGIYADRVYMHILSSNMSAVYIKSKDVAETMKTLFKLAIEGVKSNKNQQQ